MPATVITDHLSNPQHTIIPIFDLITHAEAIYLKASCTDCIGGTTVIASTNATTSYTDCLSYGKFDYKVSPIFHIRLKVTGFLIPLHRDMSIDIVTGLPRNHYTKKQQLYCLLRGIVRNVKLLSLSKDSMKRKRAQQIDDVVLLWFSSEYERQNKISDTKRRKEGQIEFYG
uniref:Uncharacterized protein n=1 Tax=Glossina pallidipes TaxID=7398 RepID=A0A1B0A5S5_GLOPL